MVRREVIGRYKGSIFGLGWSFLNPMFMLAIYTFVFSVVFKARWGVDGEESKTGFAVILYAGLICHLMFAEVVLRAPTLIQANAKRAGGLLLLCNHRRSRECDRQCEQGDAGCGGVFHDGPPE